MRRIITVVGLLLVAGAVQVAGQAGKSDDATTAKAKITPVEIMETRVAQLESEPKWPRESALVVTIHIEGDEINDAASYGKVTFTKAVDDAETDLTKKEKKRGGFFSFGGSDDDKWTSISEQKKFKAFGDEEKMKELKGFDVELVLQPSARKATKIAVLSGSFPVLAGGEAKTVKATGLKSMIGKSIEDPALKEAGLAARIIDPKKEKGFFGGVGDDMFAMELKGNLNAVQGFDVVDKSGESVSYGHSSMGEDEKKNYWFNLQKPLDDEFILQIDLMVGLKEMTVPFELKDLKLP